MKYDKFEIAGMLSSMFILIDTREQETPSLKRRIAGMKCHTERKKLDYGDYSCAVIAPDGSVLSMERAFVVERKMNLDELCMCFTKGRRRFEREFARAARDHAKVHLLVEGGSYEKMFNGAYRSLMAPDALLASYLAWSERYNLQLHFCEAETTGKLIYKILYYALKNYLERLQ